MQHRLFRHGIVDSTSERAFAELAAGRARHGDVHVADGQTSGRGRLGRTWHSAPGEGLYLSLVLAPERAWPAPLLTMALGLAALDVVRALGLGVAALDWPNDVVVRAAKLAGILVESRSFDPRRPAYVAGLGINVAQRTFPAALAAERAVTSLALEGVPASVAVVRELLLDAIDLRIAHLGPDPAPIEREFVRAAWLDRGPVRIDTAQGVLEGRLESWTVAGGAVVRSAAGGLERIALEHVRGCRLVARDDARRPRDGGD